jgi:putative nucleotidyltransferase with HDIG domain
MNPEDIAARVGDLPPFPAIAMKALHLSENPDTSARELQAVIAQDQALTARILKIVNSAMFSFQREVSTLTHAVSILGLQTLRSILIAASVEQLHHGNGARPAGLAAQLFWQHSWGGAVLAKAIARCVNYHNAEEAFTAGLLHDIGKVVFLKNHESRYLEILNLVHRGEQTFRQAESERFGFSHAEVGALVAARWKFPNHLAEAILYHHNHAAAGKYCKLAAVVELANLSLILLQVGFEKDPQLKLAQQPAARFLNLADPLLSALVRDHAEGLRTPQLGPQS